MEKGESAPVVVECCDGRTVAIEESIFAYLKAWDGVRRINEDVNGDDGRVFACYGDGKRLAIAVEQLEDLVTFIKEYLACNVGNITSVSTRLPDRLKDYFRARSKNHLFTLHSIADFAGCDIYVHAFAEFCASQIRGATPQEIREAFFE